MTGGRWDSIRNTCQIGRTIIEPTGPSLPVKEPDISVLDQSKETNGAPPSMIDTDRASGGGSGIPQWADRQEQQPISISVTGGGGRGAPGAPGAAAPAPKWLVPAIIGASMFLL